MTTPDPRSSQPSSLPAKLISWFVGAPTSLTEPEPSPPPVVVHPLQTLREAWRSASLETGWMNHSDWWHPSCDAVLEALTSRTDPTPAVARLGQARAELGCTIEESIDDLSALWQVYARTDPSLGMLRSLAVGWAEVGLKPMGADTCIDPVTRLATRPYLEARLGEMYRDARPGHPSELYSLVVVDIGQASGLLDLPQLSRVAEALRRCCTNGEPMARVAAGRFVALVHSGASLAGKLDELQELLCGPEESDLCAAIWVEALPQTFPFVQGLLLDLSR